MGAQAAIGVDTPFQVSGEVRQRERHGKIEQGDSGEGAEDVHLPGHNLPAGPEQLGDGQRIAKSLQEQGDLSRQYFFHRKRKWNG